MLSLISLILSGVIVGYMLRRFDLRWLSRLTTLLVWILLFLLGIDAGSNPQVINGLSSLGAEAAVIAIAGTLGCCIVSLVLWRIINRKDTKSGMNTDVNSDTVGAMKSSLIIVSFFAVGCIIGLFHLLPKWITDSGFSFYALCCLIFSTGMGVGSDSNALNSFRSINPRVTLLPFLTMFGTLAATAMVSIFLPQRSLTEVLSVGSGMAYYSLSSILITEYKGPELGTVALMTNVFREIITLLSSPLIARWFGRLAPISCGGASSMDSTLPIITRVCGKEFVPVSFYHGFVVDTSVPLWVCFFCSL